MKRVLIILLVILIFSITACSKDDVTHVGVNAEILEINITDKVLIVKGLGKNNMLGEKCYIDCKDQYTYFIYVDNTSGEVTDIEFEDLIVGDKITVDVKSVENSYAMTSRVQLLTQRM